MESNIQYSFHKIQLKVPFRGQKRLMLSTSSLPTCMTQLSLDLIEAVFEKRKLKG
jgi:hypothetical protein